MYALRAYIVLPSLCALSACSAVPVLPGDDQVRFSHSSPASAPAPAPAPAPASAMAMAMAMAAQPSNQWSSSQWHAMPAPEAPSATPGKAQALQNIVVYFETDAHHLTRSELDRLSQFVTQVNPTQERKFLLAGHTDSRFTASYNQSLSERRATTVSELLLAHGVDPRNITVKSRGAQEPAASNESETGRAKNRRVTLYIAE